MKKTILILLVLLFLMMAGCNASQTDTSAPKESDTGEMGEFELTDEELTPIKVMLEEKASYPNMALASEFSKPEEVNLWWFLAKGRNDKENLSAEEEAYLKAEGFEFNWNVQKYTKEELDSAMMEYFGITVDQSNGVGLDWFHYWGETGCYYENHNGTESMNVNIHRGVWNDDGSISIYYTDTDFNKEYVVKMMPKENGGYLFVSNLPA